MTPKRNLRDSRETALRLSEEFIKVTHRQRDGRTELLPELLVELKKMHMLINEIMRWRMSHEYQMHFITLLAIKSNNSFYDIKVLKE